MKSIAIFMRSFVSACTEVITVNKSKCNALGKTLTSVIRGKLHIKNLSSEVKVKGDNIFVCNKITIKEICFNDL